jgi:broad specificity phosphatase PhoE
MDYYIFRHGYTKEILDNIDYDKERVISAEIIPEKSYAIEKLGSYLKNIPTDFNVSSPFLRCKQTAEIVTEASGKQFTFDDRLGEFVFQFGEEFSQMSARIKNFVEDIQTRNYHAVTICAHGGSISAIKHWLNEGVYDFDDLQDYPNPGVLTIIKNKIIEEIDFN